jgi:hypothetical protein
MSQAIPIPMARNRKNDQAAWRMRPAVVRCSKPNATDAKNAKSKRAEKWLGRTITAANQLLRPDAISQASNALRMFTIPAAAMKRVP